MKKTILGFCVIFLISINLNAQSKPNESGKVMSEKQTLVIVDLSPIGIEATIKAPVSVKAVAGEWSNSIVGDNNFEISVEETSMTNAELMFDQIKKDPANTFLQATDKAFIYRSTMMGREIIHFECVAVVGDKTYRFYDKRVTPLDEKGILPMYNAMITLTEK